MIVNVIFTDCTLTKYAGEQGDRRWELIEKE